MHINTKLMYLSSCIIKEKVLLCYRETAENCLYIAVQYQHRCVLDVLYMYMHTNVL